MKKIYHYCSLKAMKSIIRKRSIRLSDLRKSNDEEEDTLLFKALCFKRKKDPSYSGVSWILEGEREITSIYGICFSEKRDDFVLWNIYTQTDGICLVFDKDKISKYLKKIQLSGWEMDEFNVKYVEVEKDYEDILSDAFKDKFSVSDDSYCKLSCQYKSKQWEYEKEYRICFRNYNENTDGNEIHPSIFFEGKEIKIKKDKKTKKEYYDIPLDTSIIKEIIIGPNCNVAISYIKKYLISKIGKKRAEEIKISKSKYNNKIAFDDVTKETLIFLLESLKEKINDMIKNNEQTNENKYKWLQKVCEDFTKNDSKLFDSIEFEKDKESIYKLLDMKTIIEQFTYEYFSEDANEVIEHIEKIREELIVMQAAYLYKY